MDGGIKKPAVHPLVVVLVEEQHVFVGEGVKILVADWLPVVQPPLVQPVLQYP